MTTTKDTYEYCENLIHTETSYQMDVKQSRVVTITLNEDDLIELRKVLSEIDELWDSSGEELREYYSSTAIGKLWSIL
jgi:predicted transcriptional regulator